MKLLDIRLSTPKITQPVFSIMLQQILPVLLILTASSALPSPVEFEPLNQRAAATQPVPSKITGSNQLDSVAAGLQADATELALAASVVVDFFTAIVPGPNPTAIADEISSVASVYKAHPTCKFSSAVTVLG